MIPELADCHLDHVAIAVTSIEHSQKIYEALGLVFNSEYEIVEEQKVKTAFANIDVHAHLELLEPTSEESTIAKFIQNKGEGIHHLCFRVKDIDSKITELSQKGFKFIYPQPVLGAGGCLVNFIHPKSCSGVLIELSEKKL
jgi:methylmalonyl-CoA epimerase